MVGRVIGEATSDSGRSGTHGRFALVTRLDEDFAAARFLGGITYKGKLEIRPYVKQTGNTLNFFLVMLDKIDRRISYYYSTNCNTIQMWL